MLHPSVLVGTDYTNFDFWYNGNASNQLTLYQERSELVNKLYEQRWGISPSESIRGLMRASERKRDKLRVKTQNRNPLGKIKKTYLWCIYNVVFVVGDDKWQDRPFWMRSAMVLDSVFPVLEKQAFNLYDLKDAEHYTSDLRFIWEKQEKYVEELKLTRDLQYVLAIDLFFFS